MLGAKLFILPLLFVTANAQFRRLQPTRKPPPPELLEAAYEIPHNDDVNGDPTLTKSSSDIIIVYPESQQNKSDINYNEIGNSYPTFKPIANSFPEPTITKSDGVKPEYSLNGDTESQPEWILEDETVPVAEQRHKFKPDYASNSYFEPSINQVPELKSDNPLNLEQVLEFESEPKSEPGIEHFKVHQYEPNTVSNPNISINVPNVTSEKQPLPGPDHTSSYEYSDSETLPTISFNFTASTPKPVTTTSRDILSRPYDEPTTTSRPDANSQCKEENAYYAISNECDSFIECLKYVPQEYICPDELLFNPKANWPEYPCGDSFEIECVEEEEPDSIAEPVNEHDHEHKAEPEVYPPQLPEKQPKSDIYESSENLILRPDLNVNEKPIKTTTFSPNPPFPDYSITSFPPARTSGPWKPDQETRTQSKNSSDVIIVYPESQQNKRDINYNEIGSSYSTFKPIANFFPEPTISKSDEVKLEYSLNGATESRPELILGDETLPLAEHRDKFKPDYTSNSYFEPRINQVPESKPKNPPKLEQVLEFAAEPKSEPEIEHFKVHQYEPNTESNPNISINVSNVTSEKQPLPGPDHTSSYEYSDSKTLPTRSFNSTASTPKPVTTTSRNILSRAYDEPTTTSRPDANSQCKEENAYYAIPNECDSFIECLKYVPQEYVCPDKLLFNPKANWPEYPCGDSFEIECVEEEEPDSNPEPENEHNHDHKADPEVFPPQLPEKQPESDIDDSSENLTLKPDLNVNEISIETTTLSPLPPFLDYSTTSFPPARTSGTWKPDQETPTQSSFEPTVQTPTTMIPTRSTVALSDRKPSTTTIGPDVDTLCKEENAYYAIPNECDSFIECLKYVPQEYICPDELLFNPKANWPEYPCGDSFEIECVEEEEPDSNSEPENEHNHDHKADPEVFPPQLPEKQPESDFDDSSENLTLKPDLNVNEISIETTTLSPLPSFLDYSTTSFPPARTSGTWKPDQETPTQSSFEPTGQTPTTMISTKSTVALRERKPSTTTIEPDVDTLCKEENSYYAIQDECDTYAECKNYVAEKYICPDGLLFNPKAYWPEYPCAYPSEVECGNKTIIQKPDMPVGECPRRFGNFPSNSGDCGKYVVCDDGIAVHMNCPNGLAFNPKSSGCDWPENVPYCKPKVFENFTCPAPPKNAYGRVSQKIYNYKYNNSCKEYIACSKGEPRLLRCDVGLSFDENSARCIDSTAVTNCED